MIKIYLKDVFMYDVVMKKGGIEAKVGDEITGFSGGQTCISKSTLPGKRNIISR